MMKRQILTDMVDCSCTKFAIKLLGTEFLQIMDGVGPQVQHIVPGETVPFLNEDHLGSQEGQLDGRAETAGSTPDDQAL